MAITLRAAGTPIASGVAVGSTNPSVPAGATTGDLSVLVVCVKPYDTTIATPTGWFKIGEATNGTVPDGGDVGSTKVAMFVKESAAVGAIGNIVFSGATTANACIHTFASSAAIGWDWVIYTSGGDSTNGANYSATGAAGIAVASGDVVVWGTAVNSDGGTPSAVTLGGMSGATIGTANTASDGPTNTASDCRVMIGSSPITAGSSSAAPTFAYTNASNTSGTTMWVRLREGTPGPTDVRVGGIQADVAYEPPSPDMRVGSVQIDAAYEPVPPSLRVGGLQIDVAYVLGGAAPSGPAVTVWNGSAEVAASVTVWNGTSEVAASVTEVTT